MFNQIDCQLYFRILQVDKRVATSELTKKTFTQQQNVRTVSLQLWLYFLHTTSIIPRHYGIQCIFTAYYFLTSS
jgi:hypothetical protein